MVVASGLGHWDTRKSTRKIAINLNFLQRFYFRWHNDIFDWLWLSLIVTLGCGLCLDKSQGLEGAPASSNYPPSTMTPLALLACIGAGSQRLHTLLTSFRDRARRMSCLFNFLQPLLVHRELVASSQGSAFTVCFFNCSLGAVKNKKKRLNFF